MKERRPGKKFRGLCANKTLQQILGVLMLILALLLLRIAVPVQTPQVVHIGTWMTPSPAVR